MNTKSRMITALVALAVVFAGLLIGSLSYVAQADDTSITDESLSVDWQVKLGQPVQDGFVHTETLSVSPTMTVSTTKYFNSSLVDPVEFTRTVDVNGVIQTYPAGPAGDDVQSIENVISFGEFEFLYGYPHCQGPEIRVRFSQDVDGSTRTSVSFTNTTTFPWMIRIDDVDREPMSPGRGKTFRVPRAGYLEAVNGLGNHRCVRVNWRFGDPIEVPEPPAYQLAWDFEYGDLQLRYYNEADESSVPTVTVRYRWNSGYRDSVASLAWMQETSQYRVAIPSSGSPEIIGIYMPTDVSLTPLYVGDELKRTWTTRGNWFIPISEVPHIIYLPIVAGGAN